MARTKGSKSARPTKEALSTYYRMLRDKADSGNVLAAAALIALAERSTKEAEND